MDPNNQSLWTSLRCAQEAYEVDKKIRYAKAAQERAEEEERMNRRNLSKENKSEANKQKPITAAEENNLLSSFFADVSHSEKDSEIKEESALDKQEKPINIEATVGNSTTNEPKAPLEETPVQEDELLAGFFSEVLKDEPKPEPKNDKILTEKYTQQDLGDAKSQFERIMAPHYEWKNVNPYRVLQLDIDATDEDIKYRFGVLHFYS